MKIALLSDVHANIHALEAVFEDIENQYVDLIFCLGDLVAYGAYPKEVIVSLRDLGIPTVMGNCDEAVAYGFRDTGDIFADLNEDRYFFQSLAWTKQQINGEHTEYLLKLPMQIRENLDGYHLLFVHASPRDMSEPVYEDRPEASFKQIVRLAGCDLLLLGHTHRQFQKRVGKTIVVNPGSVGFPRDGDQRAAYALIELDHQPNVELRRVAYDVLAAAEGIRAKSLPDHYAQVLESGGASQRVALKRILQSSMTAVNLTLQTG